MAVEQYHEMQRSELRAFDTPVQDLLIAMMGEGWTGRRSKGSHIQLQGPDLTTRGAISPSNNSNVNYLRQLRNRGSVGSVKPAQPKQAVDKVKCPRPNCYRVYASLEHLNVHINVDHEHKLKCPDCSYYGNSTRQVNLHRSKNHGYESPRKAQRLKAQAKREARQADIAAIEEIAAGIEATPGDEPLAVAVEARREEQKLTGSPYAAGQAAIAALFAGAQAEPAVDEELTALFEVPTAEQAVPAETTDVGTQSLELAPIRDLTVAQLIAVAAAMGKTVEITVR